MGALISKLCSHWASMYQLGVKKAVLALERPREQPIEWTSHHDCDCRRKRLDIVGARANVEKRCLSNRGPRWHHGYVTAFSRRTRFPATSKSLRQPLLAYRQSASWLGLSPPRCAACVYGSHVLLVSLHTSSFTNDMCCESAGGRMWLWFNALLKTVRLMRKYSSFSIVSQYQMLLQALVFFSNYILITVETQCGGSNKLLIWLVLRDKLMFNGRISWLCGSVGVTLTQLVLHNICIFR